MAPVFPVMLLIILILRTASYPPFSAAGCFRTQTVEQLKLLDHVSFESLWIAHKMFNCLTQSVQAVCIVHTCHDQPQPNCTHGTKMWMQWLTILLEEMVDTNRTFPPVPDGHHLWNKVTSLLMFVFTIYAFMHPRKWGSMNAFKQSPPGESSLPISR